LGGAADEDQFAASRSGKKGVEWSRFEVRKEIPNQQQAGGLSSCRLHTLTSGLFLVFLFLAPVVAQEPGGKPDATYA